MKKKISLLTIIFVVLSALIAILGLFEVLKIEDTISNLLFTCLTLSFVGILTLDLYRAIERKSKLALINLGLIYSSTILFIIYIWGDFSSYSLYIKITFIICILSVCFNLISSNILKLQKKYLYLQMPTYFCLSAIAFFLISFVIETPILEDNAIIFVLFIILSLLGEGVLAIISKKQTNSSILDKDYVKILAKEYEELLSIKEKYLKLKGDSND